MPWRHLEGLADLLGRRAAALFIFFLSLFYFHLASRQNKSQPTQPSGAGDGPNCTSTVLLVV